MDMKENALFAQNTLHGYTPVTVFVEDLSPVYSRATINYKYIICELA